MASTSNFFDAALPEPWQVLGVSLKPFSLGHYIKLKRLGCAFVADEATNASLGDLVLGVAVCSMSSHPDPARDEFWCWLNRPRKSGLFVRAYTAITKKRISTPAEKDVADLGRSVGDIDIPKKIALFNEYVLHHSKPPAYWEEEGKGGKASGADWSQSVLSALTAKCGYSAVDALNVPVSRALADFFKYAESEGAVRLMSEPERRALGV